MSELGKGAFPGTATALAAEELHISASESLPNSPMTTPPVTMEISIGARPEIGI
jgi:hypothetical protein